MTGYGDRTGHLRHKCPSTETGGQNERRRAATNLVRRGEQANSVF